MQFTCLKGGGGGHIHAPDIGVYFDVTDAHIVWKDYNHEHVLRV